jgi:radical SAM superfamily enzyme YgiQ (UPF0313 family)
VEDLKELKLAGLTLAYTGWKSGDPVTLRQIKKGLRRTVKRLQLKD